MRELWGMQMLAPTYLVTYACDSQTTNDQVSQYNIISVHFDHLTASNFGSDYLNLGLEL